MGIAGGYVEHDESLFDALRREVREETGLNVLEIGPLLYAVHLVIPDAKASLVALVFQIETWCGQVQPSDLDGADETILDAQFVPVEEAIQRLEQGYRFANEPAIAYLCGHSSPGTVWAYHGDPIRGDRLVECTPEGFYLDYVRAAEGKILELGCGTGRLLIPIAAEGYEIVGLDLSEYMLAKCREKLQNQPKEVQARVRIVHGDMTCFDLGEFFGLVTVPFRAFQHLISLDEQIACLRCANRHLTVGGKLILDLFQVNLRYLTDPTNAEEREDFQIQISGGRTLRRTHRLAALRRAEQVNDVEMIHYVTHPEGHTERLVQAFPFRYFFRYEVEHLLARCGFRVAELFGSFDRSPLQGDSPEMIFVAEKWENLSEKR